MTTINFSSRLGTPTNLPTDGKYDILLISFPDSFPQGNIKFDLDITPRKVTGIQKVAQVFMKILFTSTGSNVLYPSQGTDFQTLTVNANKTEADSIFLSDLATQIKSAEGQTKAALNSTSADTASQLQQVTILQLDTSQESVTMYLRMVTMAGAVAQVAIPFPELDLVLTPGNNQV